MASGDRKWDDHWGAREPWSEVEGWVRDRLEERDVHLTGPVGELRVRPWSVTAQVPTDDGVVWFKANSVGTAYEPALVEALAGLSPLVAAPLAVDSARAWVLLPDGGVTLRSQLPIDDPGSLRAWEPLLASYAELQRASSAVVEQLLALGVPDQRPERMPQLFADLLDDPGVAAGLSEGARSRLRGLLPEYGRRCAALAAGGVVPAVQHDDLHDGNILVDPAAGARAAAQVVDWGDASVAHPFGTLLVTCRFAAYQFKIDASDPAVTRLRDAYLEPWTGEHDRAHLLDLVAEAVEVAKVGRSLSWRRALLEADASARTEHAEAVPGWLEELLQPDHAGA